MIPDHPGIVRILFFGLVSQVHLLPFVLCLITAKNKLTAGASKRPLPGYEGVCSVAC